MPDVVRHLAGVCMLMATSCIHQVAAPLYIGAPTYPETEIGLKDGMLLKHIAGPNCKDESRPEVGTGDTDRTFSRYELTDLSGLKLCESPSGLSDPKYEHEEFRDYYRKHDRIEVFQSESGRSILIVEDRSPTFPKVALPLLQQDTENRWKQSELIFPHIRGTRPKIYGFYAVVREITDSSVLFSHDKKLWSEKFIQLQKTHIS